MPASKTMKSWISSRKRALPQSWISARSSGFSTALVFLPGQVILLRRLDGAVAQALGVVARHHQLHRREEGLDELLLLVVEVLADALGHRDRRALQLQHAERDAVDVEHDVGPLAVGLGVGGRDGDFLGDGEVILLRDASSRSARPSACSRPTSGFTFTP